jgi:hypothetical protein
MVNTNHISYIDIKILSRVGVTIEVVWISEWILTAYRHDSKLQALTTLSLIYRSAEHRASFSLFH